MGQRLLARAAGLALAAALAGCAATGEVALSPLARSVPDEPPPEGLCASLVYGLTCVTPAGYDLVEEKAGPGLVLRFAARAESPAERSHLILRAYPLDQRELTWIVDEDILGPLRRAPGVSDVRVREATLGARRGLAILARRQGEGWTFIHKLFAFQRGDTVFVVEHAAPAARAKEENAVLGGFVSSLAFR